MKKLFLLAVFVGLSSLSHLSFAGCNTPVTLSYEGTQSPTDNEFLYDNTKEYSSSVAGYKNTGSKNSGAGKGYECDEFNSGGCTSGDYIEMPSGHWFKGKEINKKLRYKCSVGFQDQWVVVDDGNCKTPGFGTIAVGEFVPDLTAIDCSGYTLTDSSGIEFKGVCMPGPRFICVATKCPDNMKLEGDKCVPVVKTPVLKKTATPKSTPVAPAGPTENLPSVFECDAVTLVWLREMQVKYNSDAAISKLIRKIIEFCTNDTNRTQIKFYDMITELKILIEKNEQERAAATMRQRNLILVRSKDTITTSFSEIQNLVQGFDVSVWKDAEGKFNTSRLVSDSVAGVVLGTAGGLITSNVVKKNQVKSGFEDISCTVGGQVVAGWGDEFNVGIR